MPPLLRSYLAMGGWVSDHAVVDRDLGTLHVFTGLEIGAIPAARARQLRAVLRDDVSVGVANVFSPA
jgi:putative hemolysin